MSDFTLYGDIKLDTSSIDKSVKQVQQSVNTSLNTSSANASLNQTNGLVQQINKVVKTTRISSIFTGLNNQTAIKGITSAIGKIKKELGETRGLWKDLSGVKVDGKTDWTYLGAIFGEMGKSLGACVAAVGKFVASLAKVVLVAAPLLVILTTIKLIKNAFDVSKIGDDIDKASQKAGMAADAYQEWAFVFERCGLAADNLASSMSQLQRNAAAAITSGNFSDSGFAKLGLSETDVQGDSGELFAKTIGRIQDAYHSDDAEKKTKAVAAATSIFGRNATQLNTVLNMTREETEQLLKTYDRLGGKMSNGLVAASATLQDSITNLKTAWQGLKNTLSEAFMPAIIKIVDSMALVVAKIKIIISTFFGNKLSGFAKEGASATKSMSSNLSAAAGTATKLKKTLASFDELNVLNGKDAGGGAAVAETDEALGISGGGFSLLSDDALSQLDEFQKKMNDLKGKVSGWLPTFGTIAAAAGAAWLAITGHPILAASLLAVAGLAVYATNAGEGEDGWESGLDAVKQLALGAAIIAGGIALLMLGIKVSMMGLPEVGIPLIIAGGAAVVAGGITAADGWGAILDGIKKLLSAVISAIGWFFKQVGAFFASAFESVGDFLTSILDSVDGFITGAIDRVATVFPNLAADLRDFYEHTIKPIFDGIKQTIGGVVDFVAGVFTGDWKRAWNGIVDIFKGIWNTMVAVMKAPINMIIGLINNMLGGCANGMNKVIELINKIKWDVPDWVPLIGGKTWGFNIKKLEVPKIPLLASGGVIHNPTVVQVGEYAGARTNPEIVAPQKMMYDTIVDANSGLVSAFAQVGQRIVNAIENKDLEVAIGDDTIAASAARGNNNYIRRTGKPLFSGT